MEKIYDVTALGEMLIDFAVNGESEQGNQLFEACPGGAPCNVLAMLNKLGRKTAFIGKVGDDQNRSKRTGSGSGYPHNPCFRTYLPGWRQRIFILPQTGSRYDAEGRGSRL